MDAMYERHVVIRLTEDEARRVAVDLRCLTIERYDALETLLVALSDLGVDD